MWLSSSTIDFQGNARKMYIIRYLIREFVSLYVSES